MLVVRYRTAEAPGDRWEHGRLVHRAETRPLAFATSIQEIGSERVRDGRGDPWLLTFRIAAANASRDTFLIDPGDLRLALPGKDSILPSIDPEAVLLQVRRDRAEEAARYEGHLAFDAIVTVAALVVDVASIFTEQSEKEKQSRRDLHDDRDPSRADAEKRHERFLAELGARELFWSGTLRKTSLAPGMEIGGSVSFAMRADRPFPDSLLLQYRNTDGTWSELGRYGLERDSVAAGAAAPGSSPSPRRIKLGGVPLRPPW